MTWSRQSAPAANSCTRPIEEGVHSFLVSTARAFLALIVDRFGHAPWLEENDQQISDVAAAAAWLIGRCQRT
jgi:hypothetical protein